MMGKFPYYRRVAATLLVPAVLAGCGSSDSAPAPPVIQPPAIVTQPASVTVIAGGPANFAVAASGTNLTYQWKRNGADIQGANAASYALATTQLGDTKSKFSVVVSNTAGSVNSTEAALTVTGVAVVAGSLTEKGSADGTGSAARMSGPACLTLDGAGNAYICDQDNYSVRKVTPAGVVSTYAGQTPADQSGFPQPTTGPADTVRIYANSILADNIGNVYFGSGTQLLRITPARNVELTYDFPISSLDGRAIGALIPYGLAIDGASTLYLANQLSLRKLSPAGKVSMLEGKEVASAQFGTVAPYRTGLAVDGAGNIYSVYKGKLRKLAPDGTSFDFAGSSDTGTAVDGRGTAARFSNSLWVSLAIDPSGILYMPDYENSTIRKITPQGDVTTVTAAGPLPGKPMGIAIDGSGNLYTLIGNALVKIQLQ
ncbi:hypothetical protein [Pseudoduganella aquatica]|uniref:Ig-like domain-containing protein n=1 Tax=Pseudoduganella aquatica TaxID=2660641 RepID=A0A7X4KND8_9BURK|nr:hypothetical protein [Pseudoduganella aquatica]MYN09118.1 hypothetical protein [Pseudoduganella aquatica]